MWKKININNVHARSRFCVVGGVCTYTLRECTYTTSTLKYHCVVYCYTEVYYTFKLIRIRIYMLYIVVCVCKCCIILYTPIGHTRVCASVLLSQFTAEHSMYYNLCVCMCTTLRLTTNNNNNSNNNLTCSARQNRRVNSYRCDAGARCIGLTRGICPRPFSPRNIIHSGKTRRSHRLCIFGGGPRCRVYHIIMIIGHEPKSRVKPKHPPLSETSGSGRYYVGLILLLFFPYRTR